MSHYRHLSITEREKLWEMHLLGSSLRKISVALGRSASTISRELKRNRKKDGYQPSVAQEKYRVRRRRCRREKLLKKDPELAATVRRLLAEQQWSPEQISQRLRLEGTGKVSYATIYRALKCGIMEPKGQRRKQKGRYPLEKHLRRKNRPNGGHRRKSPFKDALKIHDRSEAANNRSERGHLEGDTVYRKAARQSLLTLADRKTRFLWTACCPSKRMEDMKKVMIAVLSSLPEGVLKSVTFDRGSEFQCYQQVSEALGGIPIYFADPMSPWQRGTNENTNGLLRQYVPKHSCKVPFSEELLQEFTNKLNHRPRKCLDWKTPYEAFFGTSLHLT